MCDKCGKLDELESGINTINLCDACYLQFLHGPELYSETDGDLDA